MKLTSLEVQCFNKPGLSPNDFIILMQKELVEYKKIEEKLGIDLITLIKTSKGIDVDEGNAIRENVIPTIDLLNKRLIVYTWNFDCPYKTYYFKDYGKSWVLTGEELE